MYRSEPHVGHLNFKILMSALKESSDKSNFFNPLIHSGSLTDHFGIIFFSPPSPMLNRNFLQFVLPHLHCKTLMGSDRMIHNCNQDEGVQIEDSFYLALAKV